MYANSMVEQPTKSKSNKNAIHNFHSINNQQCYLPCTFKVEGRWSLDKHKSQNILIELNRRLQRLADIGNMIQSQQRHLMLRRWQCIRPLVHLYDHYSSVLSRQVRVLIMITDQRLFIGRQIWGLKDVGKLPAHSNVKHNRIITTQALQFSASLDFFSSAFQLWKSRSILDVHTRGHKGTCFFDRVSR